MHMMIPQTPQRTASLKDFVTNNVKQGENNKQRNKMVPCRPGGCGCQTQGGHEDAYNKINLDADVTRKH